MPTNHSYALVAGMKSYISLNSGLPSQRRKTYGFNLRRKIRGTLRKSRKTYEKYDGQDCIAVHTDVESIATLLEAQGGNDAKAGGRKTSCAFKSLSLNASK
jgi:hypothetical protein